MVEMVEMVSLMQNRETNEFKIKMSFVNEKRGQHASDHILIDK